MAQAGTEGSEEPEPFPRQERLTRRKSDTCSRTTKRPSEVGSEKCRRRSSLGAERIGRRGSARISSSLGPRDRRSHEDASAKDVTRRAGTPSPRTSPKSRRQQDSIERDNVIRRDGMQFSDRSRRRRNRRRASMGEQTSISWGMPKPKSVRRRASFDESSIQSLTNAGPPKLTSCLTSEQIISEPSQRGFLEDANQHVKSAEQLTEDIHANADGMESGEVSGRNSQPDNKLEAEPRKPETPASNPRGVEARVQTPKQPLKSIFLNNNNNDAPRRKHCFRVKFCEEATTFFVPFLSHKEKIDLFISKKEIKMNKILDINRKQREKEYQQLLQQASGSCSETAGLFITTSTVSKQ